jgi:2-oxo-3-hexenedioate decarboxylase
VNRAVLTKLAARIDDATHHGRAIPQLTESHRLSVDDAYAIQRLAVGRRLRRGERAIGTKLGFTSRAKMLQMGLDRIICGRFTSGMLVEDGGAFSLAGHVHPRAEPEIAFLMKRELAGAVTLPAALAAVEAVACAIEIIDSRYRDFRFTLPDVIADNCSCCGLVVGGWRRPDTDFGNLGMVLQFDGRAVGIGSSAAIMGHPARALVAIAKLLGEQDRTLEAGSIVLAGSPMAAQPLAAGTHVLAEVERLGRAEFTVS